MKCSNCNKTISKEKAEYCPSCGHEVGKPVDGSNSNSEYKNNSLTTGKKILIGVFVLFVGSLSIGGLSRESNTDSLDSETNSVTENKFADISGEPKSTANEIVNDKLKDGRDKMNKELPTVVETGLRWDNVDVGDLSITYNYTITDAASQRFRENIKNGQLLRQLMKEFVCSHESLESFRKYDLTVNHRYFLPSDRLVNKSSIQTGSCSQ